MFAPSKTLASVLTLLVLLVAPPRARAGLDLQVLNSTTSPGGSGSFDVVLNDTSGTFQIAFFSVELTVPGASGVKFTGAGVNTALPYIFGTLQSSPFTFNTFPTTDFTVSDSPQSSPGFVTLNTGDMVGLEHVTYSVAPGTTLGPVTVTIASIGGNSFLSDLNGNSVAFTPRNGTITVGATVPEPSSIALCGIAGLTGLGMTWYRRKMARSPYSCIA